MNRNDIKTDPAEQLYRHTISFAKRFLKAAHNDASGHELILAFMAASEIALAKGEVKNCLMLGHAATRVIHTNCGMLTKKMDDLQAEKAYIHRGKMVVAVAEQPHAIQLHAEQMFHAITSYYWSDMGRSKRALTKQVYGLIIPCVDQLVKQGKKPKKIFSDAAYRTGGKPDEADSSYRPENWHFLKRVEAALAPHMGSRAA